MARSYTAVGQLCNSRKAALIKLKELRTQDPFDPLKWGLVSITPPKGDSPARVGKIHLPPPPALLRRLEGLLSGREVRQTKSGAEALRLVRASLKRR